MDTEGAAEPGEPEGEGLELEAAYESLVQLRRRLAEEAHEPGRTKPYLDLVARMTKTAETLRKELEAWGRLLPKEQAAEAVSEYGGAIGRAVDGLFEEMCKLVGVPVNRTAEEQWREATRELRVRLEKEVFSS